MSRFDIGLWMFFGALALIALRMPVAVAMLIAGGVGYAAINGTLPLLNTLKSLTFSKFANYTLTVIPLFLLMGEFATKGGLNSSLFRAARAWFGHWRGGLAVATIGGCAAFGAICGSSLATAATMSKVAGPEMRRYGYSPALATGTLAAGGTLGILIPPSVILVIYAVFTEQSIGALFVAAIIPGVLAAVQYTIVVNLYMRIFPGAASNLDRAPWRERIAASKQVWPVLLVFGLVIVGIYRGWFSATEGAGVGAFATMVLAFWRGGMRMKELGESLLATAETTAMMYLIMLGAELFSAGLASSQMPTLFAQKVATLDASPTTILLAVLLAYLVLGQLHGVARHGAPHHPGLHPAGPLARSGDESGRRARVVRHPAPRQRRGGHDQPALRSQPVPDQRAGERRADEGDVQGRAGLLRDGRAAHPAARLFPRDRAVASRAQLNRAEAVRNRRR